MTHLALAEGLILQDTALSAVNFILTGHTKKHWYSYIKQDQLLNVIDMLEGDLKELPQLPHENLSIRQREAWMVSLTSGESISFGHSWIFSVQSTWKSHG